MKKYTPYLYTLISLLLLATQAEAVIKIDKQGLLTAPNNQYLVNRHCNFIRSRIGSPGSIVYK